MSAIKHPVDEAVRLLDLRRAIEEARGRLEAASRRRDRAFTARARRTVPAPVHVVTTAALTAAFALPALVVAVAYLGALEIPCSSYARVRVIATWALVSWIATVLVWMWLRRRRAARTDA
jgi:hypothetical protein